MLRAKRILAIGGESNYGREILMGIHAYCRVYGNWEFHLEGDNSPTTIRKSKFAIHEWKADGIIAAARSDGIIRLLKDSGLPVVNFSGARNLEFPTVISDNSAIGHMAARYFLNSGFRNFAFSARTGEIYAQKRCEGFARELSAAGFTCDVMADECSGYWERNWVRNRSKMDRWLLRLKKPVAMMCMHDIRGQEITLACRRLGLRVPDDVAVVAGGNEEIICLMSAPPLSSVDPNLLKIGYEAMRLLDRLIHGGKPPSKPLLIAPRHVVARQSSDIIAIDDPEISTAVRFVRDHAGEPISVKDLLQEVPISRRALERRFVRAIGRTPRAEITRVRLERAIKLLNETDLPIPDVARGAGFISPVLFSVFFKSNMGLTPTKYRQDCRKVGSTSNAHLMAIIN